MAKSGRGPSPARKVTRPADAKAKARPASPPSPASPSAFPLAWWMPLVVFLSALAVRVVNAGAVRYPVDDTVIHVPTAFNYVLLGFLGPDNWFTQPGAHYANWVGLHLFGNDPVGWQLAIPGALAVLLTFLLAREVFGTPFVAVAAAALVALDPTSIAFSRSTLQDVLVSALLLGALLEFVRAMRDDRAWDWLAAGILLGAAGTTRLYAFLAVVPMAAAAFAMRPGDAWRLAHRFLVYVAAVPLLVFLLSYMPWMLRGYAVPDWIALQIDSIQAQAAPSSTLFNQADLAPFSGPLRWFVAWVGTAVAGVRPGTYAAMLNDPVLWWTFVPATVFMLWRGIRKRAVGPVVLGGVFVLVYVFFATTSRPIFLYSSIALIPLGFIAFAWAAQELLRGRAWFAFAAAAAWSLYLLPLTCALPVPAAMYQWLLDIVKVRT